MNYLPAIIVFFLWAAPAQAQSVSTLEQQHENIQTLRVELASKIDTLTKQITQRESKKKGVLDKMKSSEKAISSIVNRLDQLLAQEKKEREALGFLQQQETLQQEILHDKKAELAAQLYTQFTHAVSPWATLLSGQDVQKVGRNFTYLSYISKSRAKAVEALNVEVERLGRLKHQTAQRKQAIKKLAQEANVAKKNLEKEQQTHRVYLKKIENDLKKRRQQAEQLKKDDERLTQMIAQIGKGLRQQKDALRQAQIQRQQTLQAHHRLAEQARKRQENIVLAEQKVAKQQQDRAILWGQRAQQAKRDAAAQQRIAVEAVQNAQYEFNLAIGEADQENAKKLLQHAIFKKKQSDSMALKASQTAEDAEIEKAKARIAKEKAKEAQRLLAKAQEDERKAKMYVGGVQGLQRGAPWPLRGVVLGKFGQVRPDTGDIWRGILIEASEGTPVKAVASGQVVFADWFKGYGNLIIIEHDNNYLSVYGYNQSVSKQVGDMVQVGEMVARAGATGGQIEPALYFEIRQGEKPVDPLAWLAN